MRDRARLGLLVSPLLLACCVASEGGRAHSDFKPGTTRTEILCRFGPPDDKQTLRKTSEAIFGPMEDFWARAPDGAKVEIWSYQALLRENGLSEPTRGATELYFVDDSPTVDGIGFAAEGVVY